MSNNPMDQIRKITEQLSELAEEVGLRLHQVAVIPHAAGSDMPDMMQCVFELQPGSVMDEAEIEQAGFDKQFESMMSDFKVDTEREKREEKVNDAKADLQSWLDDLS